MQIEIKGHAVQIDEEMLPIIQRYTWHISVRPTLKYARAFVTIGGKRTSFAMHRLLMGLGAKEVDHINGDGLDNRLSNLRMCTSKQNRRNCRKRRTSLYKGVSWFARDSKWQATYTVRGKTTYIGKFMTAEAAARAYDAAVLKLCGPEFVRLNFPLEHK